MISNVTKTADVLRGNTQTQDLWLEVEKETAGWHKGLPPPKQIQNSIRIGMAANEKERQEILARAATRRQQRHNYYISESASKLAKAKSDMPKSERKSVKERLYKRTVSSGQVRPKSPTNLGHMLATGDHAPQSPVRQTPKSPKSRAAVSSPGTIVATRSGRGGAFEGLSMADFQLADWTPSFEYKPAHHEEPWENVEGFSKSTRTLERRKMDPFNDINSFHGNVASAKQTFAHGYVRPVDVKGALGAKPVQKWKETLREDFANDNDNFSSNGHDAMMDALREAMSDHHERD